MMGEKRNKKLKLREFDKLWERYIAEFHKASVTKTSAEIGKLNERYNKLLNLAYLENVEYCKINGGNCCGYSY
jgi:hypothetical protein